MIGEGDAYGNSYIHNYVVRQLPSAVRASDKYDYEFAGWYTHPTEGVKIEVGDSVSTSTKLYARWNATLASYPVQCVDILRDGYGNHHVLGSSQWQAGYEELVDGASLGNSSQSGVYYEGREYVGSTQSTVGTGGAVVYRYFMNSQKTVTCHDIVNVGPDTGEQLGFSSWEAPYSTVASGGVMGTDSSTGTYYPGYRYISSTSKTVGVDGCSVQRYFSPISYQIHFSSGCSSASVMAPLENCYYGHSYALTKNSFINRRSVTLNSNGAGASCDTACQYVYQEFCGWSDTPGGAVKYSDGAEVKNLCTEAASKTLYAVWSEKEVNITAQPKRRGYEFAGWATKPDATEGKLQFRVEGDMELFAVWKPATVTYHVEYHLQNLDQSFTLASAYELVGYTEKEVNLGDMDSLKTMYPGFWLDETSSNLKGTVQPDNSLVLTAYFRRGSYNVSFDVNGGRLTDEETLSDISGVYEQEVTIPENYPERQGYDFAGWSVSSDNPVVVATPGQTFRMTNHNQKMYAVWLPRKDTAFTIVPYYQNTSRLGYIQGEPLEFTGETDRSVEEGLCMYYGETLDSCVKKLFGDGYTPQYDNGWTDVSIIGDGTTVVEIYLQRDIYEITYKKQGEDTEIATKAAVYGEIIKLPSEMKEIAQIDYYVDGDGNTYAPGSFVEIMSNRTLYVVEKVYYPGETQRPEESANPVASTTPYSTATPKISQAPSAPVDTNQPADSTGMEPSSPQETQGSGVTETSSPQETQGGGGTETPLPQETQGGGVTETSSPQETQGSGVTETSSPQETQGSGGTETSLPQETQSTGTTEDVGNSSLDGGQVSIISTWVDAGVNPAEVASKVAVSTRTNLAKKGTNHNRKGIVYRVTKSCVSNRTVMAVGVKKAMKTVKIPNTISIKGYQYKVTAIRAKAFAKQKKLKKIIVGENVKQIGNKAFYGNKKLKSILFNAKNVKKIGKSAWKGSAPGCSISFGSNCSGSCQSFVKRMNKKMAA